MGHNYTMKMTPVRLTLALGLSAVLAACASTGPSSTISIVAPAEKQSRNSDSALLQASYPAVTPRVYLSADQIEDNAPQTYTVVRGDTLWDISDRFLKEPWRWTEIWKYNEQILNPHLIYPKDVIALNYVDGKPIISLTRNGTLIPSLGVSTAQGTNTTVANGIVKLSPRIRKESLEDAISTIKRDSIAQFLMHPRVMEESDLASSPYVVANGDDRLISSTGSKIYARGKFNRNLTSYSIFRKNKVLIDPVDGKKLGYEIVHVSDAKLLSVGDPSVLSLTRNKMETVTGDILLPVDHELTSYNYTPRLPALEGEGRIVSLANAITQTGKDQVVVLNVGSDSNLQEGDVLAVETRGLNVIDTHGAHKREHVQLPNQRTGVLMVFKTFDKVSYALVMESTRPIKVNDIITGI